VAGAEGDRVRLRPGSEEQARVCSAKGLGGGIRVADEHQLGSTGRDRLLEQPQPRRGELLGVVDDHEAQALGQGGGVVLDEVGGRAEDPRRVERPGGGQRGHLVVLAQDVGRRHPLPSAVVATELRERLRLETELDGTHEQVTQLAAEGAGGQGEVELGRPLRRRGRAGGVAGEQLAEDDVLLGAAQQSRGRVTGERGRLPEQAEPEGLVRARQGGGGRAAEASRDGIPKARCCTSGRGEQQALVSSQPLGDRRRDALDGHRGLAGAGCTEHPNDGSPVLDRGLLRPVEDGGSGLGEVGAAKDEHPGIPPRPSDTS
jgi:hypothetical protein